MKRRHDDRKDNWFQTLMGTLLYIWFTVGIFAVILYALFHIVQWVSNGD